MDCLKYKRGSVWFVDDHYLGDGHIQSKSLPYVVVSNDDCNARSTVIHMAPITSTVREGYHQDVIFTDVTGVSRRILCGHIMPKDIAILNKCSNYIYSLSDETMKRVDTAIRFQFFYKQEEEDLVREIQYNQETAATIEETPEEERVEEQPSQIDKFNKRYKSFLAKDDHKVEEIDIPRTAAGRIRWTDDIKSKFLKDAKEYIDTEMMVRYRMTKNTYLSIFYRLRKEFEENSTQ